MPAVAHPPTDNPLDHALALVEAGLRPVPIKPGGKHPPMANNTNPTNTKPSTQTDERQACSSRGRIGVTNEAVPASATNANRDLEDLSRRSPCG